MLTGPYSQNYFVLDFQHDTVYKCRVYNERDTQGNIILSGMWIIPIDKNMGKTIMFRIWIKGLVNVFFLSNDKEKTGRKDWLM